MEGQVLVTYATKYGATAEIAEKIGEVLRESGLLTDVLPVKQVADITSYTAVILGSAVYIGRWRKEAVKFLEHNEQALTEQDVWFFSSGPTGEGDPAELLEGWKFPPGQQPIADRIHPHDIVVFHGSANTSKMNFMEKWMSNKVDTPLGDFRDWEMITVWATAVVDVLKQSIP